MDSSWTTVRADDHGFGVFDAGDVPIETADWSNGLIVTMSTGALLYTGIHTGNVRVQARTNSGPPSRIDAGPWEEIIEASVYSVSGNLRIDSPLHGQIPGLPLLSPTGPGWYRVRAHARGRDIAYDTLRTDPVEDYLLITWPAPPAPTITIRTTDRCGQGLRSSTVQAPRSPTAHPGNASPEPLSGELQNIRRRGNANPSQPQ